MVLGFEGIMIIGCKFIKCQRNEMIVKLMGTSLSGDWCITSYIRFIHTIPIIKTPNTLSLKDGREKFGMDFIVLEYICCDFYP